jgi:hypothetical protein
MMGQLWILLLNGFVVLVLSEAVLVIVIDVFVLLTAAIGFGVVIRIMHRQT